MRKEVPLGNKCPGRRPRGTELSGYIRACYATGSATGGTSARVGGLVGQNDRGYIRACYAKGSATGGDDAYVGGLVGSMGILAR